VDTELIKLLSGMGIGGIFSAFTVWILNKAWKEHAEQRISDARTYQDKLLDLHNLEKGRADKILDVVIANTNQTTVNTEVLKSLHRRLDKDAYDREKELK